MTAVERMFFPKVPNDGRYVFYMNRIVQSIFIIQLLMATILNIDLCILTDKNVI